MQKHYTFYSYFTNGCYAFLASIILFLGLNISSQSNIILWEIGVAGVTILSIVFGLYFYRNSQFKHRQETIGTLAQKNNWSMVHPEEDKAHIPQFQLASIAMLKKREAKTFQQNCIYTPEWSYCDYSYEIYQETKYGTYKQSEYFYALMGTVLPRKLPNIMFDSIKSRKRQFKVVYDNTQLHVLEGNFDQHFATYFPKDYTIDSLSFITPDVMDALVMADDYDIEIIDNNLFIFGPIRNPELQIPEMAQKLQNIKKELLDNILTYRDERLPYQKGRQEVAAIGTRLASAKDRWWITALIVAIYLLWMWFSNR